MQPIRSAGAVDGEYHALLAVDDARDPSGSHVLAIGMRNGAGHAGNVVVAGEQADPRRICEHRGAQQESLEF